MVSSGFQLTFDNGVLCEVTNKPRRTIVKFPCDPNKEISVTEFVPLKAFEGDKKLICHYYMEFPASQYGCPIQELKTLTKRDITIEAGQHFTQLIVTLFYLL